MLQTLFSRVDKEELTPYYACQSGSLSNHRLERSPEELDLPETRARHDTGRMEVCDASVIHTTEARKGLEGINMKTRREFIALAVTAPLLRAVTARSVEVEYVFDAPGNDPKPNGLQATAEGLRIYDQTRAPSKAYLVRYEDGKVLRTLETDAMSGGGITFDGEAIWISSSYNCKIIRVDAHTGKTLASFDCPGVGPVNWPHPRTSPIMRVHHGATLATQTRAAGQGRQGGGPQLDAGGRPRQASNAANPQGRNPTSSHGLEWKDGKLWAVVPPAKMAYNLDPKTFAILNKWPTAGDRPHGIGWEGRYLWAADTNLNAFHKYDPTTGEVLDMIQLKDTDPLPHGMTIWRGDMWYADDVGVICRLKTKFNKGS